MGWDEANIIAGNIKELTVQGIRWITCMNSVITKIDHTGNWKESDPWMLISSVKWEPDLPRGEGDKWVSDDICSYTARLFKYENWTHL